MSTRTHFLSVSSIEPIQRAVASNDRALVESLMERYARQRRERFGEDPDARDLAEFRDYVESMILCASPPAEERGCWNYVIELLAEHLSLNPDSDLPFNEFDWKHFWVWEDYIDSVANLVDAPSQTSLTLLAEGRPLKGERLDGDGCVFAWLNSREVKDLANALESVDSSILSDELIEFHDALVASLKSIEKKGHVLFEAAH